MVTFFSSMAGKKKTISNTPKGVEIYGMMAADGAYLKGHKEDRILNKLVEAMRAYPKSSDILGGAYNYRLSELRLKFGYDDGYMEYAKSSLSIP